EPAAAPQDPGPRGQAAAAHGAAPARAGGAGRPAQDRLLGADRPLAARAAAGLGGGADRRGAAAARRLFRPGAGAGALARASERPAQPPACALGRADVPELAGGAAVSVAADPAE